MDFGLQVEATPHFLKPEDNVNGIGMKGKRTSSYFALSAARAME
jgi:hypothetical protein